MSISMPPQAVSSSDPERVQPSQESLCPAPMEISVQEVAETTFPDLLDEDPYSAIYKTLVPYLSEKDCYNLTLTCKRNYRTVSKIFLLSLLGKKDVDYQSLETWRKRSILADENVLQAELAPLLTSFGLPLFCTEENKKQTLDRITMILNPLKESDLFTDTEKRYFATLSDEEIFGKPTLLYLLLQLADRDNLVRLFEYECSLGNATTFPQKVAAVLNYLQDNEKTTQRIEKQFYSIRLLTNIPNEVCNLTQLKEIYLSKTSITELPESIGNLTQLKRFMLYDTLLAKLPESIGDLTKLEKLDLCDSQIKKLPGSIGNLTQLKELKLRHAPLTELPESIGNLTQLNWLSLNDTQIKEFPESVGNLTQLKKLDLMQTEIEQLPESIGNLTQLKELNLSYTPLTELPGWIGNLIQLDCLYLNETPIKKLPESIGNLTQLRGLYLYKTSLKKLPEALSRSPELMIDLSYNSTIQIPRSLATRILRR